MYFPVVIAYIRAELFAVGEIRWDLDVLKRHAAFDARLPFVAAMRVRTAEPETERPTLGPCIQEFLEVFVSRSGGISLSSARLVSTGPPPLARIADVVTRLFQEVWINRELGL